jgi:hypothetical protein
MELSEQPVEEICWRTRTKFWCVAWILAGLTSIALDPVSALFFWAFPLGLLQIFFPGTRDGSWFLFIGWILYALLTRFGLAQNRSSRFFLAYAALCFLLVLNVVGCHSDMKQPIRDSL